MQQCYQSKHIGNNDHNRISDSGKKVDNIKMTVSNTDSLTEFKYVY